MINLHVYPTTFTRESRILRETAVIAEHCRFDRIIMVGICGPGLPERERIDERREIWRFPRAPASGLVAKLLTTWRWARMVYAAFRREPVACVNCHSLPVLKLCARLARATGAKLVYDTHELETETNGLGGVRKRLSKIVERALIRRADAVIVVSKSIGEWYANTYGIAEPTLVLNAPARVEVARTQVLRELLGIAADQRIYLYVGVIAPGRGIDSLCAAFASLPAPRPALVFMGEGVLEPLVREHARRCPDIHLAPAVAPSEVLRFTASADVGLCVIENTCLSYEYCMPNKIFEYICAGIPAIASDLPELRRVVAGEGIGVVARDQTAAGIAEAVQRMQLRDFLEFREPLRAAADKYSWSRQVDGLLQVYGKLGFLK